MGVLDKYMPYPARFRLAWSVTHGSNPFYAWEAVPPGDEFLALGFIGSKVDKQPDVTCMRCIPRDWCKPSGYLAKIWDDSGSGGRQGSIWIFNTLNLIEKVRGFSSRNTAIRIQKMLLQREAAIKTQR